jgi:hypothetical protein
MAKSDEMRQKRNDRGGKNGHQLPRGSMFLEGHRVRHYEQFIFVFTTK